MSFCVLTIHFLSPSNSPLDGYNIIDFFNLFIYGHLSFLFFVSCFFQFGALIKLQRISECNSFKDICFYFSWVYSKEWDSWAI